MEKFEMTRHAIGRALDMSVPGEEIREAMEHPDNIYWSPRHEAWNYQRGRIALGIREDQDVKVVLTVMWATDEAWAQDALAAPLPQGRELRGIARTIAASKGAKP